MTIKVFKLKGADILINIESINFIKTDENTGANIIYCSTHFTQVDESLDKIKELLGIGPKKISSGFKMA